MAINMAIKVVAPSHSVLQLHPASPCFTIHLIVPVKELIHDVVQPFNGLLEIILAFRSKLEKPEVTPVTRESSLDGLGQGSGLIVVCSCMFTASVLRLALFKDVATQTAKFLGGFSISMIKKKGPHVPVRYHSHSSAGVPVRVRFIEEEIYA